MLVGEENMPEMREKTTGGRSPKNNWRQIPKNQMEAGPQKPSGGKSPKIRWRQVPKTQLEAGPK